MKATPTIDDALRAPPPRSAEQVAALLGRAGRGYRLLAALCWCVGVSATAYVGWTTPARRLGAFAEGLALFTLIFGGPVLWFARVNLRQLRRCAKEGVLLHAVVEQADRVGPAGQQVVDARFRFERPQGGSRVVRVSGLAAVPPVGGATQVLYVAEPPEVAGVWHPPVGILTGRVSR